MLGEGAPGRPGGDEASVIHPIPPGTRDVLPGELRELRALERAMLEAIEARGYGPVATPAIEYDVVLERGDPVTAGLAYRFFDERGRLAALRPDMTVPIARLVSTRFSDATEPIRLCYAAPTFRTISPQRGQEREFRQVGVELVGAPAPEGTAEVVEVLVAALDAAGLPRARIGLGDAALYASLLADLGIGEQTREPILHELMTRDLVGLEREAANLPIGDREIDALVRLPRLRGGPDVLDEARGLGVEAVDRALARIDSTVAELQGRGVLARMIVDLGLVRYPGYYTGAVLEVYDPAVGDVLGGGGRYDELLGRFGSPRPAAGFALNLEQVHVARAEEERLG